MSLRLNLSALDSSDPFSKSFRRRLSKQDSPCKSSKNMPKNSVSSESFSLIHSAPILKSLNINSTLSNESLEQIREFKQTKIQEYKKALEKCLNHSNPVFFKQPPHANSQKMKKINQKADQKRKEISLQRDNEELKRIKQSQSLKLTNLYYIIAKKNEKIKKQKILKEKIRKSKTKKEKKKNEQSQKEMILENIKNFYTDRIEEIKSKIEEEKAKNKILRVEKLKNDSDSRKAVKSKQKEKLRASFLSID